MIAVSEKAREIAGNGGFTRQKNRFTTPFGNSAETRFWNDVFDGEDPGGFLPVEPGRYRLIVAKICPWAHRQLIVLRLLGLSEGANPAMSIGVVNPVRGEKGWEFSLDPEGIDPVLKIRYLSEAYLAADPDYAGRATVPAVVDLASGKVVNNDYHRLSNYWETVWKPFHKPDAPELYPEHLRTDIDALNKEIFLKLNNGVYRAGFAQSQGAYREAYTDVFAELDKLEDRLAEKKFLFGGSITDSDVRLYVTLARFDCAYYNAFRCNKKRILDYPHLWRYARELYRIPAFGKNTDFDHIKRHYHLCCDPGNVFHILPEGPDESAWLSEAR
jgi:putative glutathione S-transferase